MKNERQHIAEESVRLLVEAGADKKEAEIFVSELSEAVPEFPCRFYPGILRWTTGGDVNVEDDGQLERLNLFLKYIINTEAGEFYDGDFNGKSFEYMVEFYHLDLSADEYTTPEKTHYTSVEVPSYEALQKYREWTDDWCITLSDIAFAGYSLDGINKFFLLLRNDFRSVPKKPSAGFPNDDYGHSILCVIVTPEGGIESVTNRWNAIGRETNAPEEFLSSLLGEDYKAQILKTR